jgi:hypothetical protein
MLAALESVRWLQFASFASLAENSVSMSLGEAERGANFTVSLTVLK